MNTAPLFHVPKPRLEKTAGYSLPRDPSLWQAEVIQHLASQHPYLPLEKVEVNFKKLNARKGSAVGAIMVGDKIAIPLMIKRPSPSKDPELEPLDVFYHGGSYHYLDPDAVRSVIMEPEIGRPAPRPLGGSNYPGRNDHYIGDLTGDRSPLEHSYFGGHGSKLAADAGFTEWLVKEAEAPKRKLTPAERSALSFGTAGAVGGGLRGALKGALETPGTMKQRAVGALAEGAKDAALLGTTGAIAGGVSAKALEAAGIDRAKLTPEQRAQVHGIAQRKIEKKAYVGRRPLPPRPTYDDPPATDRATHRVGVVLADEVNPKSESGTRSGFSFTHQHESLRNRGVRLLKSLREEGMLDPNDLANFRALLTHNPDVMLAARNNLAVLGDVIDDVPMKDRVPRQPIAGPRVLQIFRTGDELKVKFSGREPQCIDNPTLKQLLGDEYRAAMRKVEDGQVFVMVDEINPISWTVDRIPRTSVPVDRDGQWLIRQPAGQSVPAYVAKSVMKLDGTVVPMKMAITADGKYAMGREMFGARISDRNSVPGATKPESGSSGCFVHYVQGSPTVTVPLRIDSVSTLQDEKGYVLRVFKVTDLMSGDKCAVIPSNDVFGIMPITWPEPNTRALVGDMKIYAIPAKSEWIKTTGTMPVAQSGEMATKVAADHDGRLIIREKDGLFSIDGSFSKEAIFASLGRAATSVGKNLAGAGKALKTWKNPVTQARIAKQVYKSGKGTETGLKGIAGGLSAVGKAYAPELTALGTGAALTTAGYGGYKAVTAEYNGRGDGLTSPYAELEWRDVNELSAREALIASGIDSDGVDEIIKTAKDRGLDDDPIIIKGVNPPLVVDEDELRKLAEQEVEYTEEYTNSVMSLRPGFDLVKAAAETEDGDTLDSILSLEFITPQNARYFYESVDQFEEVASKLAALLVAVRLGLQHVPKASVRDALEGLSKTISRLKVLKSAMEGSDRPGG